MISSSKGEVIYDKWLHCCMHLLRCRSRRTQGIYAGVKFERHSRKKILTQRSLISNLPDGVGSVCHGLLIVCSQWKQGLLLKCLKLRASVTILPHKVHTTTAACGKDNDDQNWLNCTERMAELGKRSWCSGSGQGHRNKGGHKVALTFRAMII